MTSIEDNWVFVYIVLEEIYDFRFFYRNVGDMMERYPGAGQPVPQNPRHEAPSD